MSLEKRIKRHVIGRRHEFFAVTLPGFEALCSDELATISDTIETTAVFNGGVSFEGRLSDLYAAALHARIPVRLLMRLARFKASNFGQLEKQARSVSWELYLPAGVIPEFHVTAHHSRLYHTGAISDHLAQCIAAHWAEQGIDLDPSENQSLYVRLENDTVTISIDACGEPLYRRGLKPHNARAPIRETTAAGILLMTGFQPGDTLVDPMCGSGTFSLEAAMLAKLIPPGFLRNFDFMAWPAFRPRQWAHIKKIAGKRIRTLEISQIRSSDVDERAVENLYDCVRRNHLEDAVRVSRQDFFTLQPGEGSHLPGLVVLNPPYGRRLKAGTDTHNQYLNIAAKLRSDFKGWRFALIVPHKKLVQRLGLSSKALPLQHGGLNLTLLIGKV